MRISDWSSDVCSSDLSYFASIGLPHEAPMLVLLTRYGYRGRTAPVFIQSFEVGNLKAIRAKSDLPLIQLMDGEDGPADDPALSYAAMATPEGLKAVAAYADRKSTRLNSSH